MSHLIRGRIKWFWFHIFIVFGSTRKKEEKPNEQMVLVLRWLIFSFFFQFMFNFKKGLIWKILSLGSWILISAETSIFLPCAIPPPLSSPCHPLRLARSSSPSMFAQIWRGLCLVSYGTLSHLIFFQRPLVVPTTWACFVRDKANCGTASGVQFPCQTIIFLKKWWISPIFHQISGNYP